MTNTCVSPPKGLCRDSMAGLHSRSSYVHIFNRRVQDIVPLPKESQESVSSCAWPFQGCLTGRTWRFGRPFRTWTDGHTCPSFLFRQTFACKNIFTNFFFNLLGVLGNFCEADVSNQDPQWTGKNGGHAHTGEHGRKRLHALSCCKYLHYVKISKD